jgi:glycosyltransferase involved in cell wall biosynthesis
VRILLLSAYHANSHKAWADGLVAAIPAHQWTVLTLPPRHFSWRLRGNSLSWALLQSEQLNADYDLLVATSMTDLSALRGLCPSLCRLPTLVYFHENQFAYPVSAQQRQGVEPQMLNLYTALAADKVLFNSDYNRQTFIEGADRLLAKLPDFSPRSEVMNRLSDSEVLPVGIAPPAPAAPRLPSERLSVLWNHRWEYDKGPEQLLAVLQACERAALPLDMHIIGQQFRKRPKVFGDIERLLTRSQSLACEHFGYVESREQYEKLLAASDVVLSTALHDFQGLAVMEAVAAGCRPLLPARLCYPQWFDAPYLYDSALDAPAAEAESAGQALTALLAEKRCGALQTPDISDLYWPCIAAEYQRHFDALCR